MIPFKKRKGGTFTLVLMMVVVFTLIGILITILVMNNALHAQRQRERTQAYFITLAGLEMGMAALFTTEVRTDPSFPDYGDDFFPLFETFEIDPLRAELRSTIVFDGQNNLPDFSDGSSNYAEVEIRIRGTDESGEILDPGNLPSEKWIEIAAMGTYTNERGEERLHSGSVRFLIDNPLRVIREVANPNDFN